MKYKAKGPIAEEYKRLYKQIEKLLNDSDMFTHVSNLGYLLHSYGIIKKPHSLFSNIKEDLIRAIIKSKTLEK